MATSTSVFRRNINENRAKRRRNNKKSTLIKEPVYCNPVPRCINAIEKSRSAFLSKGFSADFAEKVKSDKKLLTSYLSYRYKNIWLKPKYKVACDEDLPHSTTRQEEQEEQKEQLSPSKKEPPPPLLKQNTFTTTSNNNTNQELDLKSAIKQLKKLKPIPLPSDNNNIKTTTTPLEEESQRSNNNIAPPLVAKIKPYWTQSLLTPVSEAEKLGMKKHLQKTSRTILSNIDIYEAKGLAKKFDIISIRDLFQKFSTERIAGRVGHMKAALRQVVFSDAKVSNILFLLESLDACVYYLDKQEEENDDEEEEVINSPTVTTAAAPPPLVRRNTTSNLDVPKSAIKQSEKKDDDSSTNTAAAAAAAVRSLKTIALETKTSYLDSCASLYVIPREKIFDKLVTSDVDFSHVGLGKEGSVAVLSALMKNTTLQSLNLTDNWIQSIGGIAISRLLPLVSSTLVYLNLRENRIGSDAALSIFEAITTTNTISVLKSLNLRGNEISDRALPPRVVSYILSQTVLETLDLSHNRLRDACANAFATSLVSAKSLSTLHFTWNSITNVGASSIAKSLEVNTSVTTLSLGFNSISDVGGYTFSTAFLSNNTLESLDLSGNRLSTHVGVLLADSLTFNKSVGNLNLSQNPIGDAGLHALLNVMQNRPIKALHLKLNNMQNFDTTTNSNTISFDAMDPDGYYSLTLSQPADAAIAELLHVRLMTRKGIWKNVRYNDKKVSANLREVSMKKVISLGGVLSLEYTTDTTTTSSTNSNNALQETVHFDLDLSTEADRETLRTLIERAIAEPGENWLNESLDGVPFQFTETREMVQDLQSRNSGIFSVDYLSTKLICEKHYRFDVGQKLDRSIISKMLSRLFASIKNKTGDSWKNLTHNGKSISLSDWENVSTNSAVILGLQETSKRKWRVPLSGIVEFDYYTSHPQHCAAQHYILDLQNPKDLQTAHHLRVRAQGGGGECWWNETINGYPFECPEDNDDKAAFRFPTKGILEFDFVVLRNSYYATNMASTEYKLDLSIEAEYIEAEVLRYLTLANSQECFWNQVQLDDDYYTNLEQGLPAQGLLEFELISTFLVKPISSESHELLLEQLDSHQHSPSTMFSILHLSAHGTTSSKSNTNSTNSSTTSLINDSDRYMHFNSYMVLEYVGRFETLEYKHAVLETMYGNVVDKHALTKTIIKYFVITSSKKSSKKMLASSGIPDLKELQRSFRAGAATLAAKRAKEEADAIAAANAKKQAAEKQQRRKSKHLLLSKVSDTEMLPAAVDSDNVVGKESGSVDQSLKRLRAVAMSGALLKRKARLLRSRRRSSFQPPVVLEEPTDVKEE